MARDLGFRSADGKHSSKGYYAPGTTLWVVTFDPNTMPQSEYEVYHGFARGPGGFFVVYIDDHGYGVAENGIVCEYAPTIPMHVRPGQTITCNWSINTGTAPRVDLYLREAGPL